MSVVARAETCSAGESGRHSAIRSQDHGPADYDDVLAGLDAVGQAVCLLDQAWRILAANAAGQRFAEDVLTLGEGRIMARTRDGELRLGRLRSLERGSRGFAMLTSETRQAVMVRVVQLATPIGDARTILTFTDFGGASLPCEATLRQAFGLTATEAGIALEIARGARLGQIAIARGVGRETVRSHLRTVFDKTGTRRQVALAILLVRLHPLSERASCSIL